MSDSAGAHPPGDDDPPEPQPPREHASVPLLLDAVGRLLRYGGELVALEARNAGRTAATALVLAVFAALCGLTAWLALNAGVVWLLQTWLAVHPGLVLLGAALVNVLMALLIVSRARRRLAGLRRSPLQAIMEAQRR